VTLRRRLPRKFCRPNFQSMEIDRELFMRQGFLILRNLIPRDQIPVLRWHYEIALEAQKLVWAKEAGPDDPPGGHWETSALPTLGLDQVLEPQTAPAMEFCLGDTTLGVSEQLMQSEAAPRVMQMLCSPIVDVGYSNWHRDVGSVHVAPYEGLSLDTRVNGPGELQWNIPLYDDDVFWLVPGSHLRPETDGEARQLLKDAKKPLPGGEPVELKAGDAVVYTNIILHWGSLYTAKVRRTVHLAYRAFGSKLFPHYHLPHFASDYGFAGHLSAPAQKAFERFRTLYDQERDDIAGLMRAIIDRDEAGFRNGLDVLHPGAEGKMVALILLSQWVKILTVMTRDDIRDLPMDERSIAAGADLVEGPYYADVADRFTERDGAVLHRRFAGLETQLASDHEAAYADLRERYHDLAPVPGDSSSLDFHQRSTRTLYGAMPAAFGLDEFVASWNGQ
jgi:hypothetical protein